MIRFNRTAGRYIDARGRFVPQARIRAELDRAIGRTELRSRRFAEDLRAGRLSLTAWRTEMRTLVKDVHLYSAALAKGGKAQLTAADYGRVGRLIRQEYQYLERFATEIKAGIPLDGRFSARAAQYAQAGRDTYHVIELSEMRLRGMGEERNILHPAEHCAGEGSCVEESERGWVPIGTLIPIGRRRCRRGCKCTKAYRRAA